MVHLVHVLHGLAVGGLENGVVNLVGALAGEFRHTVVAVTERGPLAARLPAAVDLHHLGKRPGLDGAALVRLTRLLRGLRPDLVHTRNWGAIDAVPAARLAGVPVVIHGEHGREATDPHGLNPRRNRMRRLLAPFVDRFVTVSLDLHRWLVDTVRLPAAKVVTIHNGVDLTRFDEGDRGAMRRALNLPGDAVVLGTVGRLDPVKDHVSLVDAFARLAPRGSGPMLVVAGEGPCRSAIEARIRERGVGQRVRLLGQREDIPGVMRALDVFVLPSLAEGISNTILEAMASGLPIVATAVGGNPELVAEGQNGRLVPPRDAAALGAALDDYVRDGRRRRAHGQGSRRRAIERFSLERMAASYRALYVELTSAAGRRRRRAS